MADRIHRNSLSAWHALSEVAGLEPDDRDADLIEQLIEHICPGASNLEKVLSGTPTDVFLHALFQAIQPFALMYEDILTFFKEAGAREGQDQWKISIGKDFVEFEHFHEFLNHWKTMHGEFEIPHLDRSNAFILNSVRNEDENHRYLLDDLNDDKAIYTGIDDVDAWFEEYNRGEYADFPHSLDPANFPRGLDDIAAITLAALQTIQHSGLNRRELIEKHRARGYKSVPEDALHLWTIAQSETDYWLKSSVLYLAALFKKPVKERHAFGEKLATRLAVFPRRHIAANITVNDMEKLLSLPAWKRRYEFYGVWVAAQIISSFEGHDYTLNSENGELKFAFSEARLAEIKSAQPPVVLYSERYTKATNLVGKGRTSGVKPDFGIWELGRTPDKCKLIVEVKHYKKRSKENFRGALIDYAYAHPNAQVLLVNYGPVGEAFKDLDRCEMIGHFRPDKPDVVAAFQKIVRQHVGEPVIPLARILASEIEDIEALVIDVSGSMSGILNSDWFVDFMRSFETVLMKVILVDNEIRASIRATDLEKWLQKESYNGSTSLAPAISEVLSAHSTLLLLTDKEGSESLNNIQAQISAIAISKESTAKLFKISL